MQKLKWSHTRASEILSNLLKEGLAMLDEPLMGNPCTGSQACKTVLSMLQVLEVDVMMCSCTRLCQAILPKI